MNARGANASRRAALGHRLQRPHRRRPDGDDAASGGTGAVDAIRRFRRDLHQLLVHPMVGHTLGADRLKRAQPHVQRHGHALDAPGVEPVEHTPGEVQARRRRRHRPVAPRVEGLVVARVGGRPRVVGARAADVRRQRRAAHRGEQHHRVGAPRRPHVPDARLPPREERDLGGGATVVADDVERLALPDPSAAGEEHFPEPGVEPPEETPLDASAGGPPRRERRRNDPRVVQDQQVAGPEHVGQVAEPAVRDGAARAMEHE